MSAHIGGSETVFTPDIIGKLNTNGLFINTGRAANVDKEALLERMKQGLNVGLDVYWNEGQDMFNDPVVRQIVQSPNFMGTAHTAASDDETQKKLGMEAARAMTAFITQGAINPKNIPDHTVPAVIPSEKRRAGIRIALLHTSKTGTLAAITGAVAKHNLPITGLWDSEDEIENMHRSDNLAYTVLNVDTSDSKVALKILEEIRSTTTILKSRLLQFV